MSEATMKVMVNGVMEEREIWYDHLRYGFDPDQERYRLHKKPFPKTSPDEYIYENSDGIFVYSKGWVG